MLEIIYQELVLNSSTASHPDTVHEFAQCFLLLKDLWLICGILVLEGQGGNTPCSLLRCRFFTHTLIEESLIAADDRRHGASHLSQWVSIKDLIKKTSARPTENTPIPSKDLVKLQFIPKKAWIRSASSFTSRLQVQHKI